jgi:hypothetical protein
VKKRTSFQFTNLVKSFTFFFFGLTFLWAAGNYIAIRDVLVSWPIFIVNVTLSVGLAWWYYRYRYHTVFSYDESGFDLQVGRQHTARRWTEFSTVSLVHLGHGDFAVCLYDGNEGCVEIPASALRLNPQEFRFEVMDLIGGSGGGAEDQKGASHANHTGRRNQAGH